MRLFPWIAASVLLAARFSTACSPSAGRAGDSGLGASGGAGGALSVGGNGGSGGSSAGGGSAGVIAVCTTDVTRGELSRPGRGA